MAMEQPRTCHFKLVLLGDASVGKSCLVVRFAKGEFYEYQEPTIGAAFMTQTVSLGDVIVKYEIWDTAGQERYRSLAPMYYRGAAAAVVVYDISCKRTFEGAKSWVLELKTVHSPDIVIALAGNKADLESAREVDTEVAEQYARENGCLFKETSAKTGLNVHELFHEIAQKLPKQPQQRNPREDEIPTGNGGFTMGRGGANGASDRGWCCMSG